MYGNGINSGGGLGKWVCAHVVGRNTATGRTVYCNYPIKEFPTKAEAEAYYNPGIIPTTYPAAPIPYQNKTLTGHRADKIIADDPYDTHGVTDKPAAKPPIDFFAINKEFASR